MTLTQTTIRPLASAKPKRQRKAAPCNPEGHASYLALLGKRVRAARAQRGMTRKILARDSGVSERYLAQLEAGRGNVSIALLRQIAMAMNVPLVDLVRDGAERSLELTLMIQRLQRLAPEELAQAGRLLTAHFGLERGSDRHARIALIGLRGAGKSTLGGRLAAKLDRPFFEMADEIAAIAGMSLDQIFDLSGQGGYRRYEKRALERLIEREESFVLATGGGLVAEAATYDLLLSSCLTVWIKAAPEEHMRRVMAQGDLRPMAGNKEAMEDLRSILVEREALYSRADFILDTAGKREDQAFSELLQIVERARRQTAK